MVFKIAVFNDTFVQIVSSYILISVKSITRSYIPLLIKNFELLNSILGK